MEIISANPSLSARAISEMNIVKFTYDDLGQVAAVKVGDRLETDYAYHLHGQANALNVSNTATGDTLFRQTLNYEDVAASTNERPRYDGMISKLSTTYGIADSSGNRVSNFLYDMPGNLVKRSGTAPEATFSFDKNGRTLTQGYDGSTLGYNYYDDSYRLNRVTGSTALDSARNASRTNNFIYDASGRMIADSSKNLSVEYDPYGMPVSFVQMSDSSIWRELMVYDPSGWRIATFAYENDTLQAIRTDIMVGGKKALERHRVYVANDSSIAEYKMIQGKSGIVGRVLPDSSKEWYIKDYQGSLVMTLIDDGTGNVFAYEPYGVQKKIQVSGDSPAEQYTGKEYNERIGFYYYGMRFFDPVFGIWMTPDPARQYTSLYAFGGDPINALDLYGLWKISLGIITIGYENGGFTAGVGFALDVGNSSFGVDIDFGYSHNFGNGSNTYSANVGASANIGIFNVGANLGYAYNDQTGGTLSYGIRGGAYGVGAGIGGAQYWDTHGDYLGSTLYVETYAGAFGAEAYTGYEWGFSGMEGRGLYTGARAWGAHAEWSSNMGFTWGVQMNASYSIGENGYTSKSLMNGLFSRETWENGDYRNTVLWKEWGKMTLGHGGYMMDADMMQQAQLLDENSDIYYFWGHSDGYVMSSDPEGKQNRLDAAALANRLEQGMYGYDAQQTIQLYACNAGLYKNGFAQQLANNMGVPIIASTIPVEVKWNRNNAMHKLTVTDVKAKWKTFNPSYDN